MEHYNDLAKIIMDYKAKDNKEGVRERYNTMRIQLDQQKILSGSADKLNGYRSAERVAQIRVAGSARVATIGARGRLAATRSARNDRVMTAVGSAVSAPGAGNANGVAWQALFQGLTEEGAADPVSDVMLPQIFSEMKNKGYDWKRLPEGTLRASIEAASNRSESVKIQQADANKELDAIDKESQAIIGQLESEDGIDARGVLMDKLQSSLQRYGVLTRKVEGAGDPQALQAAIDSQDAEDADLKKLQDKLDFLGSQMVTGGGTDKVRQRLGTLVGREGFREWALDNGYTDAELGSSQLDAQGVLVPGSFAAGKKTLRAVKHFEWQLMHPKRQSKVFGVGKNTNELWEFDRVMDPARVNTLAHTDGKWYTISDGPSDVEGIDARRTYINKSQLRTYQQDFSDPSLEMMTYEGQMPIIKSGDVYYRYDKKKETFSVDKQGAESWNATLAQPMIMTDAEGNVLRYMNTDDIRDGVTAATKDSGGFSRTADDDAKGLEAKLTELGITSHDSPPADALEHVVGRRQRSHATRYGEETFLTTSGQMITLRPEDMMNVESHDIRDTTNLIDVARHFRGKRLQRLMGRIDEGDPGESTEITDRRGNKRTHFGSQRTNIFNRATMGKAELDRMDKETTERNEGEDYLRTGVTLQQSADASRQALASAAESLATVQAMVDADPSDENKARLARAQADVDLQTKASERADKMLNKHESKARISASDTARVEFESDAVDDIAEAAKAKRDAAVEAYAADPSEENKNKLARAQAELDASPKTLSDDAPATPDPAILAGETPTAAPPVDESAPAREQRAPTEGGAAAQAADDEARDLFGEGDKAYKEKRYKDALASFRAAYEQSRTAENPEGKIGVMPSIANTLDKMGDTKTADKVMAFYTEQNGDKAKVAREVARRTEIQRRDSASNLAESRVDEARKTFVAGQAEVKRDEVAARLQADITFNKIRDSLANPDATRDEVQQASALLLDYAAEAEAAGMDAGGPEVTELNSLIVDRQRQFDVADKEDRERPALQAALAGTTPEAALAEDEARRAALPEDLEDPPSPDAGRAAFVAAEEKRIKDEEIAAKRAAQKTKLGLEREQKAATLKAGTQSETLDEARLALAQPDLTVEQLNDLSINLDDLGESDEVDSLRGQIKARMEPLIAQDKIDFARKDFIQRETERAANDKRVDEAANRSAARRDAAIAAKQRADMLAGISEDEQLDSPSSDSRAAQTLRDRMQGIETVEDIEFKPNTEFTGEPATEPTDPDGPTSLLREAESKGQPSMSAPTDTAGVSSGVGVPGANDKFKAEATELVKKNMEIRNMLYPQDDEQPVGVA
jgi:hypothetical protein